jgi:AcrR family transcriptional regulator
MPHVDHGAETPNQRGKQRQIIEAARRVLARDGLAGCTARAVAQASPLTKSAMHYYFKDIDDVVDQAMTAHLEAFLQSLGETAEQEKDPARRLWRVVDAYLATFAGQPHAARLWFEYWIALSRRNASGPIRNDLAQVTGLFQTLLGQAGHARPDETAGLIVSWLLGVVIQQDVQDVTSGEKQPPGRRELQRLIEAGYE